MKKIILLIVLILSGIAFGQSGGKWIVADQVRTWTDSLQFTANDSDAVKDSVMILNMNFSPSAIKILVKGDTNGTVGGEIDSIGIQVAYPVYNEAGTTVTETNYGSYIGVKDSAWNTINVITGATTNKDYTIFNLPPYTKMKFSLLNASSTIRERTVQITVEAWKDK